MLDWLNLGMVLLFLVWGGLCFWVGRRPQEAKAVATKIGDEVEELGHTISGKVNGLFTHSAPGAQPLASYADASDLMLFIGASQYPGQVELDGKIVKSGTLPGVKYITSVSGVMKAPY
jgi:hypothetical protein